LPLNPIMTKPYGAYVADDDPSVVYVWADLDAPGGRLSAIRVGGRWKPSVMTFGDLEDRFRIISDDAEVDALLEAARAALSEPPAFTLRRLAFDGAIFCLNGDLPNRTLN
jgi:hypothetical protein